MTAIGVGAFLVMRIWYGILPGEVDVEHLKAQGAHGPEAAVVNSNVATSLKDYTNKARKENASAVFFLEQTELNPNLNHRQWIARTCWDRKMKAASHLKLLVSVTGVQYN